MRAPPPIATFARVMGMKANWAASAVLEIARNCESYVGLVVHAKVRDSSSAAARAISTGSLAIRTARSREPRAELLRGPRGSSQRRRLIAQNSSTASEAGSASPATCRVALLKLTHLKVPGNPGGCGGLPPPKKTKKLWHHWFFIFVSGRKDPRERCQNPSGTPQISKVKFSKNWTVICVQPVVLPAWPPVVSPATCPVVLPARPPVAAPPATCPVDLPTVSAPAPTALSVSGGRRGPS